MYMQTTFSIGDTCYIVSNGFIQTGVVTGINAVLGSDDDIEQYLHATAENTEKPSVEHIITYTVHVSPNLSFALDDSKIYFSEYAAKEAIPVKNIIL